MLPQNGKIAIIDDNIKEVEPLFTILSRKGAAFHYFSGRTEDLPDKPILGIRIIFLDIELEDTRGVAPKTQASALAAKVTKVTGTRPNPYFIAFWTGHKEVASQVIEYLKDTPPVGFVSLPKPTQSDFESGTVDVAEIESAVESALSGIDAFKIFLRWERAVSASGAKFINELTSVVPNTGDALAWSRESLKILASFYKTISGEERISPQPEKNLINSSYLLNKSYCDCLDKETLEEFQDATYPLVDESISIELTARLNSKLFFDQTSVGSHSTGSVYLSIQNQTVQDALVRSIFKSNKQPANIKLCSLIITPSCDMAHAKYLKQPGKKYLRLLHGLLFQVTSKSDLYPRLNAYNPGNDQLSKPDSHFYIDPFWFDREEKACMMIFHFGSLTSDWIQTTDSPPAEFVLRDHLAFDVQSKMSNHANRLGNYMLPLQ